MHQKTNKFAANWHAAYYARVVGRQEQGGYVKTLDAELEKPDVDPQTDAEVHDKEIVFHNKWAASARIEDVPVLEIIEAPTAPENRFILKQMGDLILMITTTCKNKKQKSI